MKKHFSRIIALALILTLCLTSVAASAEARASDYFSRRHATSSAEGGGKVKISFTATGTSSMTEIGATKIELKSSSGALLKTYYSNAYPVMMGYNKTTHSGSVTYPGVVGDQYYAVVYFKAANSSGSGTDLVTTYLVTAT